MKTAREQFTFRVWSTDGVKRLKEMWWNGMDAERIALILGNVTATQVREGAHRRGFTRNPELKAVEAVPEPTPVLRADGKPVTMADVHDRECHWIYGMPGAQAPMCGNVVADIHKGPWCLFHFGRLRQ